MVDLHHAAIWRWKEKLGGKALAKEPHPLLAERFVSYSALGEEAGEESQVESAAIEDAPASGPFRIDFLSKLV
jgi:hypothetical protein